MEIRDAIDDFIDSYIEDGTYERALSLLEKKEHQFEYIMSSEDQFEVFFPETKKGNLIRISIANESDGLEVNCNHAACRRMDGSCHHALAALLFLSDGLESDSFDEEDAMPAIKTGSLKVDEEGYFNFTMNSIDPYLIGQLSGYPQRATNFNFQKKIRPVSIDTTHQQFQFADNKKKSFSIDIIYDGKTTFKIRCTCENKQYPLCEHVAACFYLLHVNDKFYFNKFRDFTAEKNKLLQPYGLTVEDPEAKLFAWQTSWNGTLELVGAPQFIIPAGSTHIHEEMKLRIRGVDRLSSLFFRPRLPDGEMIDFEIGFVLNFTIIRKFGFELDIARIRDKNGRQEIKKLSIQQESNLASLQSLPDESYIQVLEFAEKNQFTWLENNGGSRLSGYSNPWSYLSSSDLEKLKQRHLQLLEKLWPFLTEWPFVFALKQGNFAAKNITPAKIGSEKVNIAFTAEADNRFITLYSEPFIEGRKIEKSKISMWRNLIFEIDDVFYLPASEDILPLMERFSPGFIKFPITDFKSVLKNILAPLKSKYTVAIKGLPDIQFITSEPQPRVMLSELNEQYLMIRPQFLYDDIVISYDLDNEYVEDSEEQLKVVTRNKSIEKKLYEYLRQLHPKFSGQRNNLYYYLPFKEVMINNWFFSAIHQIQNTGFPVYGLQELKKFKYNTGKPTFNIKAGSGVDWFDLKISVNWGDQHVSLNDIRKAIINNQNAVLLGDGTLGWIPEEWLKQYAPLMKIATEQNGALRVSKLHYMLLDTVQDHLNEESVKVEIAEKKKKLLNYDKVQAVAPSPEVKALLRPYQVSGFNWLQTLDDLGWGGCLADDMGLGKTLQTITFLQYLKEKHPANTHLVICPTSLIFNWQSEIRKFCPSLQYHIYYGLQRTFDDEHFERFDVVLTTYGMIRNDLDRLMHFQWHYIILDESQAIKNPEAMTTRAVQKLRSKNRIILSGTPVQNNTYDLYAQFTFLNPGFLGSREFFKNEFAQAIDGKNDKEKASQLRRMIYPFMLRRTKEQVATDLPDKTVMVLWCNMEKEQRQVYDAYKEHYRNILLQKIDEEGIAKAGIYVLEGLLRLRQICDHPALLNDENIKTTKSVKAEEIMREIQENTSDHKLIVFSQFTEMLAIIRTSLLNAGIKFTYLDGSTPAAKRETEVKNFQEDETIKVFLISLKAGGVGLNLTAADYVYLVDPWWNPAAEQQAIDRTHRIGQTKKIFAYKMICKDSVEEKILQLQDKKKALAGELISEETGFVKKLTRDDIEYLFS